MKAEHFIFIGGIITATSSLYVILDGLRKLDLSISSGGFAGFGIGLAFMGIGYKGMKK